MGRRGYTLIELVIVILLIGILAAYGVPQYLRTVEAAKADDAVSVTNMIGTTNRMYALDHAGVYAAGAFPASGTCASAGGSCAAPAVAACALVLCHYLADMEWGTRPYTYYACNGAVSGSCGGVGAGNLVSASRRSGGSAPYSSWSYAMSKDGAITAYNGAPAPTY